MLCLCRKKSPNIFKQEAEERIKLNEEKSDDKSNEKMENINQEFIKILDVVRSHKHCCLFESRLPSQVNKLLIFMLWFVNFIFVL